MAKELVVVESPAKARTVGRFLGSGYETLASMGHVRDLPKGGMGVEIDDKGFHPTYAVMPDKKKVVSQLRKASKSADVVYLATDPDREGEAISWHLLSAAGIAPSKAKRVVFHEITKEAISEAFDHPRDLDYNLIDAQQARRILDRLVGYRLSPVLWNKVRRGLSAGRVQSVALRIVVEREREIQAFTPVEHWSVEANLAKRGESGGGGDRVEFKAALHSIAGDKKKIEIPNQARADELLADLEGAAYETASVRKRERRVRPSAPFITSTMQQQASSRLGFTATRTMRVAQQLYEGISIGDEGSVGLITYMRTDSTNVAGTALSEAGDYIRRTFGADYAPKAPRTYTKKVKGAQEAHEAIRPTSALRTPQALRQYLNNEQFRLYELIWRRMLASQMTDAVFDATRVDIDAKSAKSGGAYVFRATGSVLKFPGFRALYMDEDSGGDADDAPLPPLDAGDGLDCLGVKGEQHFTQPPPRFNEASLIRALEERGIGRPSTYAPIVATIEARDYVVKDKGRLTPTKLGIAVTDLLTANFPDVMSVDFTAMMEQELDNIAEGQRAWEPMLRDFYEPFDELIEKTMKEAARVPRELLDEETDELCEKCERPMLIKSGRFGRFMACSGYPECKNTKQIESAEERALRERVSEETDEVCEKCERPMAVKSGRNGRFLACTGYPDCKNAKPFPVGVACPDCGGDLVERKQRGRGGRIFYGCVKYPDCKFAANPLPQPCPDCGKLLVSKGRGRKMARCLDDGCGYDGPTPVDGAPVAAGAA